MVAASHYTMEKIIWGNASLEYSSFTCTKLGKPSIKKNGKFSDIVQKGGRGSDQKPNFMNTEKK